MRSLWRSMPSWKKFVCLAVVGVAVLGIGIWTSSMGKKEPEVMDIVQSPAPTSTPTPNIELSPEPSSSSGGASAVSAPTMETTASATPTAPVASANSNNVDPTSNMPAPSTSPIGVTPTPSIQEPPSPESVVAESTVEQYQGRLSTLRNGCMDRVNNLVTEVIASLKENGEDEAAIATLQQTYLPKIMNEEASCDKQFSELITEAEQKGVAASDVTNWKGQYEKTKEDARNQALQMLLSAFPIKSRSE